MNNAKNYNSLILNLLAKEESNIIQIITFEDYTAIKNEFLSKDSSNEAIELDSILEIMSSSQTLNIELLRLLNLIYKNICETDEDEFFDKDFIESTYQKIELTNTKGNYKFKNNTEELYMFDFSYIQNFIEFCENLDSFTLLHILYHIEINSGDASPKNYFCISKNLMDEGALLRLKNIDTIINGDLIHNQNDCRRNYINKTDIIDKIDSTKDLKQFEDIFSILSEYNSTLNLCDKFIKLYHILENFMVKKQICGLVNSTQTATLFSVRHFSRLASAVDKKEEESLKNLFASLLNHGGNSDTKVKTFASNYNICQLAVEVRTYLNNIGYASSFNSNIIQSSDFSKLVYRIRNSIVHNKETEFHLSQDKITSSLKKFFEEFIFPSLETIIYNNILEENQSITYTIKTISLY